MIVAKCEQLILRKEFTNSHYTIGNERAYLYKFEWIHPAIKLYYLCFSNSTLVYKTHQPRSCSTDSEMLGKEIALVLLIIGHAMLSTHMVEATGIKIAAYNIRIFGRSKLQNQVAMNMITQVFNTKCYCS